MRAYSKDLRKAQRWLAAGRSTKVIHFLEPKVPLFLEDPHYYALLGRAYLNNGSYGDADTYLNRGLQTEPSHLEVRLTLAVNHLKRKDPASAVRTWLEVLEDFPNQKQARKGLRVLKRIASQEQQDLFVERFDIARFLPRIGSPWPSRILIGLSIALIVLLGLYFRDDLTDVFSGMGLTKNNRDSRPGSELLVPERDVELIGSRDDALFFLSESEVTKTLKKAVKHFQSYEDNNARRELNRIILSNATDDIRGQAILLRDGLGEATIEDLDTDFSYSEVIEDPELYDGCLVLWRGKTANVNDNDGMIKFDFLVGFDEGTVLEGRLPVEVPFLTVMEPLPLELLAAVEVRNGKIVLVARTLHFLR